MSAEIIAVTMGFQAHMLGDIILSYQPMEMGWERCCFHCPETIANIFDFRHGYTQFETQCIGLCFGCMETAHFHSNFNKPETQPKLLVSAG
jgi:hypothetical protein